MSGIISDNYLSLKTFENVTGPKVSRKTCFATVKVSYYLTSTKIRYFFTAEKYQFYSYICALNLLLRLK